MHARLASIALLALALLLSSTSSAEARRGIGLAIINTGEDVTHVADIKEEYRAAMEMETAPGVAIGVTYSRFGLFWVDIVHWDSNYVLFRGDTVWNATEEEIIALADGKVSKPFLVRFPPGMLLIFGAIAFFIGRAIYRRMNPPMEYESGIDPTSELYDDADDDYPPLK